jgi:hypothetical protein
MNRLRILLITSALIAGSSALASAEEYHQSGLAIQVRFGDRDRGGNGYYRDGNGYYGYRDGDRDDHNYRYVDRDDRGRDRDDRWRHDRDDRRQRDWDHDGDRR